jgi:hypothetical protein
VPAPRRHAAVLSVVALAVLAVVAATAVAGLVVVSFGLAVIGGVGLGVLAVSTWHRWRSVDAPVLPPVSELSTDLLGREWLRTSSALLGPLAPATRDAVATRRQDTLDELERRDPAGFARWLADDSPVSRNPAEFLHGSG